MQDSLARIVEKILTEHDCDIAGMRGADERKEEKKEDVHVNLKFFFKHLHLNVDFRIGNNERAKAIAAALEKTTTLTRIYFTRMFLLMGIGWWILYETAITLNFTFLGNAIGVEGAKAIAAALEKNSTLTRIALSSMFLLVEKVWWIFYETVIKLNILFLVDAIGDEGAKAIAAALEKNTTLTEIHLNCMFLLMGKGWWIFYETVIKLKGFFS